MKRIAKAVVVTAAVTVFCIALLPQITVAQTYEVLKELNLSNGKYTGTIDTQYSEADGGMYVFKGVEVAVRNGTEDSKHRVACAEVSLDSEEIFSEKDFNSSYIFSTVTVPYDEDPTEILLEVRVSGTWKSSLYVKVTGIYEEVVAAPPMTIYYLDEDGDGVGGPIIIETAEQMFYPWVLIGNDLDDSDPFVQ